MRSELSKSNARKGEGKSMNNYEGRGGEVPNHPTSHSRASGDLGLGRNWYEYDIHKNRTLHSSLHLHVMITVHYHNFGSPE